MILIIMGWALWIKEILRVLWDELGEYKKYYDYYGVSFVNKRNITILIIIMVSFVNIRNITINMGRASWT